MQITAHKIYLIERTPESVGGKLGENLMTINLFDNQRYDEHHRRPYLGKRRHKNRGRRRTIQVNDPSPHREGIDHTYRALVGVRQRQHREKRIVGKDRENSSTHGDLRTEIRVGEHHALGTRRRTRGVDDDREVFGIRNSDRPLLRRRTGGDHAQILGTNHDMEGFDRGLRQFSEELVGNHQRLGLGVGDNHLQLFGREIGQDRHGDHAGRGDGQVRNAPVGHVAAQQRHLVARFQTGSDQKVLHVFDAGSHLGIGELLPAVHGKSDFRCKTLYTVLNQFVKCMDSHFFRIKMRIYSGQIYYYLP